jgi:hypothetical protein
VAAIAAGVFAALGAVEPGVCNNIADSGVHADEKISHWKNAGRREALR